MTHVKAAQTEAPCILCSDRGVVDFGLLFGCRTPGRYDPCPMCALRKQRDDLVAACELAEQFTDALIEFIGTANLADDLGGRQVRETLRAALAKAKGEA